MMQIRRLIFVETGTYEDQMLRPYDTQIDQRTIIQLQEATGGGSRINSASVAGIAGQIVAPTAMPQGMAMISNGWGEKRFRFLIEVTETDGFGTLTIQYLSGFTDYVGISLQSQILDPQMSLYFNNSVQTQMVQYLSPIGNVNQQKVMNSAHILTGSYNPSFGNLNSATHSMRPEDVFAATGASTLMNYGAEVIDTRTSFAQGKLKKSKRANTSAPSYLSSLINTHNTAMAGADEADNLDETMGKAAGAVREPMMSADLFLSEMMVRSQMMHGGCVKFQDLLNIEPNLDQIARVILARSPQAQAANHVAGQSEHWNGAGNETVMATILSHAVPGLMMDLMFVKVGFNATNRTLDGQMAVALTGAKTFAENLDMTRYLQSFVHRLQVEILNDLSRGGMIDFEIEGEFDVIGDTNIRISVMGGPWIHYTTPSWGDALFVPVITNDQHGLHKLSQDIMTIAENLQTDYSPATTYNFQNQLETRHATPFAL